jgi:hypothetical protein
METWIESMPEYEGLSSSEKDRAFELIGRAGLPTDKDKSHIVWNNVMLMLENMVQWRLHKTGPPPQANASGSIHVREYDKYKAAASRSKDARIKYMKTARRSSILEGTNLAYCRG